MTALLVIVILVVLIVVHEFGHFVAAKIFGVKVEEFGVGYPPRAFLFGKLRDTEYTLNWIPFGGFVRLFGDEGENVRGKGSFVDAHRGVQAAILAAGVLMNAFAGWALFAGGFAAGIPRPAEAPGPGVRLIISDVLAGSPAEAAGLKPGDELLGVSDATGASPASTTPLSVQQFVESRGGKSITVSYERAGATSSANVIPANAVVPGQAGRPALGIALVLVSTRPLPIGEAMGEAWGETRGAFLATFSGLGGIVRSLSQGNASLQGVVGPVGLVSLVGEAAQTGLGNVLALAGFISVNLAVINLIPIPALDGGRLLLVGVEAVIGRRAPRLAVQLLNALGIALIAFIMITVTLHDVSHLLA